MGQMSNCNTKIDVHYLSPIQVSIPILAIYTVAIASYYDTSHLVNQHIQLLIHKVNKSDVRQ